MQRDQYTKFKEIFQSNIPEAICIRTVSLPLVAESVCFCHLCGFFQLVFPIDGEWGNGEKIWFLHYLEYESFYNA